MADVEAPGPASSHGSTAAPPPRNQAIRPPAAPPPPPPPPPPAAPPRPPRRRAAAALAWARSLLLAPSGGGGGNDDGLGGLVSYPGLLSLVGAAWLLLLARAADGEARVLAGALCLDSLSEAPALVAAPRKEGGGGGGSPSSSPAAAGAAAAAAPPPLVAVRGRVCASNPRACELDPGAKAVIHEVVEEDIYLARGATGGLVRAPFETRRELAEREWWLEDGSAVRVRVEGGRTAARLGDALEVRQEYRERQEGGPSSGAAAAAAPTAARPPASSSPSSPPPPPLPAPYNPSQAPPHHHHHHPHPPDAGVGPVGVVQATLGWTLGQLFVGQRHQGTRKTERFLPVGAIVTVVGELARFGGGGGGGDGGSSGPSSAAAVSAAAAAAAASLPSLVVRRPSSAPGGGRPFYVTSLSPRQLHAALAANARTCRALAACLGVVGCALLARRAARRLWLRHRQRQARERVLRAEAARERRLQQQAAAGRKAERRRRRRRRLQLQEGGGGAADAQSGADDDATSKPVRAVGAGSGGSEEEDDEDDEDDDSSGDEAACGGGGGKAGGRRAGGGGGDDEVGLCTVCLTASSCMVFTRCGHLCACAGCAGSLDRCPICRARSESIRVYRT